MTPLTDKKQYPSEQYLNELITNIEFAARAPVEVVESNGSRATEAARS
ncbi:hypothetical protein O5699_11220 [Escherichia coli]|nr:hypothetical protein [Escherichia coli]